MYLGEQCYYSTSDFLKGIHQLETLTSYIRRCDHYWKMTTSSCLIVSSRKMKTGMNCLQFEAKGPTYSAQLTPAKMLRNNSQAMGFSRAY